MGDSTNQNINLERSEKAKESSNNPNLLGDMLVCGSISDSIFQKKGNASCFLPDADKLLMQLGQNAKDQVCTMPTTEKFGPSSLQRDEYGDVFEITDQKGVKYTKGQNGSWTRHETMAGIDFDDQVRNVTINARGDIAYDSAEDPKVHYEKNADGTSSSTFDFGTYRYDADHRLVEAPSGPDGQVRKFHYDENGKLDQIDGRLGHWDRQTVDGKISWKNKDTGAVWEGEFSIDGFTNDLEYRGANGSAWNFTIRGEDKRMPDHAETFEQEFERKVKQLEAEAKK